MSLEFKGGDELRNDISRMADLLRADGGDSATTNRILEAAAQPVLEQMIQNASTDPKPRSGNLRSALRIAMAPHGFSARSGIATAPHGFSVCPGTILAVHGFGSDLSGTATFHAKVVFLYQNSQEDL
jgi:hypothetical protein